MPNSWFLRELVLATQTHSASHPASILIFICMDKQMHACRFLVLESIKSSGESLVVNIIQWFKVQSKILVRKKYKYLITKLEIWEKLI